MSIEMMLIVGRIIERLTIVGFAGLSLWLGWRLFFFSAQFADQSAEVSWKNFVLKLQKVAPGIFFALFGASVLAVALWKSLSVAPSSPLLPSDGQSRVGQTSFSYIEERNFKPEKVEIEALNLAVEISKIPPDISISNADRVSFAKKASDIELARNRLIAAYVGFDNFNIWSKIKAAPSTGTDSEHKVFDEIELIARRSG
jgi:hypothetical protein